MAKVGTVRKEVGCRAGMRALGVYMRQSGLLALSLVALMLGATRGNASSGANGEREATQEPAFVVVIDAGSSGSRVHVFQLQWNVELGKTPSLPEVKLPAHKLKIEPGLSTYAHRPRDAGASILPLIDFAERHVPQAVWAQTPLLVVATAGLRLLPTRASAAILHSCEHALRQRASFPVRSSDLFVLGGADEGAYGWLAVNFLAQRLRGMPDAALGTLGAVEVGGASSQVAFEPTTPFSPGTNATVTLRVGGAAYRVLSRSFLGMGQDEMRRAL
ncbi:MAG: hypothetical protein ACPIOQ_67740, partial [Promethearchaeia archaeon]